MVRAKAPLVITFLLCVGCVPRHRVAIDLRVDGPTEGIREIGLDLIPEGDGPPLRARRTLGPADDLGAGVRVAVLADVPPGPARAQLHLVDDHGGFVATSSMIVEVSRSSLFLVVMDERCASTVCEDGESCLEGACGTAQGDVIEQPFEPPIEPVTDAGPAEDSDAGVRDAGTDDAGPGGQPASGQLRGIVIGVGSAISTPIDANDAGPGDATDAGPRDRPRDGHDGPMQQPAAPAR